MGTNDRVIEALESSDLARALFLEAGDALLIVEPLTERVLDANPTAVKLSKLKREDLLRRTIREVVRHELGWDEWLQTVQQTTTFHGRDGYLLRSGSGENWTPVSLTIARLHLPNTPPLALLTFRDRSEQVEAYRRVQRTEIELRRVLVSVSDCLYSYRLDARGQRRYRYLSPVVERLAGRPVSYFLDDPWRWGEVVELEDQPRWREFICGLQPQGSAELEYRIRRPDGALRWVRESIGSAAPEEGTGLLVHGILSDITERKRAEMATEERRQLESQKLESLGVLAGSLAHDFNNLLTGILGNAGLARMSLASGSETLGALDQIEAGSLRAAEICRQLLTFTGKGRVVLGPVGLDDVVRETAATLLSALPPRVEMKLELAPDLPPALADAAQVRQVLVNLVVNAVEAMANWSGAIRVRTDLARLERATATMAHFAAPDLIEGEAVALEVRDNGPGISPEVQARMFDPFFTTRFRGRGLGLAVVQGIVHAHKGAIFVESAPGVGTAVRVVLPRSRHEPALLPPSESPATLGLKTVLVADDEDAVRTVTGRMLEAAGYQVILAHDGHDVLEKYRQHAATVRLVLLDLTMPRMTGEDAFRSLRQLRPDLPVIVMSGYPETDVMNRFVGAGLSAFLQKPFRPMELLDLVRQHFQGTRVARAVQETGTNG
jgi:signal transduction histidine kinase/ActR/RegA family two-component response regulator